MDKPDEVVQLKSEEECLDTEELAKFRSRWRQELGLSPSQVQELAETSETSEREPESDPKLQSEEQNSSSTSKASEQDSLLSSPEKGSGQEISGQGSGQGSPRHSQDDLVQSSRSQDMQDQDPQSEAMSLYWMGAAAEQSGDMSGALLYYQRAVQLDPEVEFKAPRSGPPVTAPDDVIGKDSCESNLYLELSLEFQGLSARPLCQPRRPTKETHISMLPVEVLRYILRWVASSQCDMRAVEIVSRVSKGFYLLAREPQLWRSACKKVWGEGCQPSTYNSWRKMFILKPHLHFNGVYISKTSYVRCGERSLDGFYKPFHTVTYFRYLRFFADGSVMYQTTPEEPGQVVSRLCHKHSSEAVLLGEYQVQDRTISIDLVQKASPPQGHSRGRGKAKSRQPETLYERRFHMELLQNKRKSKQLTWIEHSCNTLHVPSGHEQVTHFSINYMYTPFHFSRVRSFTLHSTGLL